jgi:hypothetical protein
MDAYMPEQPTVERTLSEDSSAVFTCEVKWQDFFFAVIAVKFSAPMEDDVQQEVAESYMDFLKGQFGITSAAGYGRGHTLESHGAAKGIIDFWQDGDGNQYQLKTWVDSKNLAVMMIYGPKEFPNYNVAQVYLNGFRFPEQ